MKDPEHLLARDAFHILARQPLRQILVQIVELGTVNEEQAEIRVPMRHDQV